MGSMAIEALPGSPPPHTGLPANTRSACRDAKEDTRARSRRYNTSTCLNPWLDVRNNTPAYADIDSIGCNRGYNDETIASCVGIRDSVMEAFTQNNPSVCLAPDDLEAVQTLYPDCELSVTTPVCYRVNLNLGFVRISVYVLVPLLVILGLVVLMQAIIQSRVASRHVHKSPVASRNVQ